MDYIYIIYLTVKQFTAAYEVTMNFSAWNERGVLFGKY